MTYKGGTWGDKAKARSKERHEYFLKYRSEHPVEWSARNKVAYALRKGKLKKLPCEREGCESKARIEGHHPDYSKPLEVVWLCATHHHELHKELNASRLGIEPTDSCSKGGRFYRRNYFPMLVSIEGIEPPSFLLPKEVPCH